MKEIEKKEFAVKFFQHPDGYQEKDVFIGGERLDYSIDISAYMEAERMGPAMKLAVQKDIERHFTECVSEVLGRKVTLDDIKKAIVSGWI